MKYKIRGVVYLLIGIIIIGFQALSTLGLFLMAIDSSPSYHPYVLGLTIIWLAKIIVGVILLIKSVRLFRANDVRPYVASKLENVALAVLILLAWVVLPIYMGGEKDIQPLAATPATNASIEDKIKSINPTVASLPQDVVDDLGVAYRALRMLYERPAPADLDEYFVYTECAKHVVNEVALPKLSASTQEELSSMVLDKKFTSFTENNFRPQPPLFLAIQSLVASEVGENKVRNYIASGLVDADTFYSPSKEACQNLDIPEKYKI